jgi:hypothetical protein
MNQRILELLDQIKTLEEELHTTLHDQEKRMFFQIKGKRIEFEKSVKQVHRQLKTGFLRWLVLFRPQNLVTGPVIYSMIFPMLLLDLCVSFYQFSCFPIYRMAKVKRADYIVFDRQHLGYLNFVEILHCTYCAYGIGLLAYVSEIVSRTEQYFCPIKHAHKMLGTHSRYAQYLDFGDGADYAVRLEAYRQALAEKKA